MSRPSPGRIVARFPQWGARVTVFTVGHSTRTLAEFLALLRAHGIRRVVDVRRHPGSRRYPHFARDTLRDSLARDGIDYVHEPGLGGRRRPLPGSRNAAWRSASFRGYADHMAEREFTDALARILADAAEIPTALMCAEAVPWRCHRQLIADALVARGIAVRHIIGSGTPTVHGLHPAARIGPGYGISYPAPD